MDDLGTYKLVSEVHLQNIRLRKFTILGGLAGGGITISELGNQYDELRIATMKAPKSDKRENNQKIRMFIFSIPSLSQGPVFCFSYIEVTFSITKEEKYKPQALSLQHSRL